MLSRGWATIQVNFLEYSTRSRAIVQLKTSKHLFYKKPLCIPSRIFQSKVYKNLDLLILWDFLFLDFADSPLNAKSIQQWFSIRVRTEMISTEMHSQNEWIVTCLAFFLLKINNENARPLNRFSKPVIVDVLLSYTELALKTLSVLT